jgi:hypothetical protein
LAMNARWMKSDSCVVNVDLAAGFLMRGCG